MLRLAIALSLVVLVGVRSFCTSRSANAHGGPTQARRGRDAGTPPNLPHVGVYLARDLGYFQEEGLDVEIKNFESGVQVLRGGIADDIDVVGSSSEPVVAAIAQGANLKVIYSYAHALTVSLVVQEGIKSPADLRGKNMGIQDVGAFREMMSRIVLKQAGLTPEDVHYVPVASANYIQGLLAGQLDTAVCCMLTRP